MDRLILYTISKIKYEWSLPTPTWKSARLTQHDREFIEKESQTKSNFDRENVVQHMWNEYKRTDSVKCTVRETQHGRVVFFHKQNTELNEIPWELWGRIFRACSSTTSAATPIPTVYLFGSEAKRYFPPLHQKITEKNINGGYTYPCNLSTIVIYRKEDATRVLIHELLHAYCTDAPHNRNNIDIMEAETEAWAELFYCIFLSRGNNHIARLNIRKQAEWMSQQNKIVERYINKSQKDFPWRYTIGKEEVWKRWMIAYTPTTTTTSKEKMDTIDTYMSLRLTRPPSNATKKEFNIADYSTIL
jgi:hypothetical protein